MADKIQEYKNNQFRILFWNARSFIQRQNELQKILEDLDVFICVESKLSEENKVRHRDFSVYRKDRRSTTGRGKGGAGL